MYVYLTYKYRAAGGDDDILWEILSEHLDELWLKISDDERAEVERMIGDMEDHV